MKYTQPDISIVVPTYNRCSRLRRVLTGFEHQTYPLDSIEVVVVSDGSVDGTNEFLTSIQTPLHLVPIVQPNGGVAMARNRGVAESQGDIVLFVDDDVVPTPTLVSEHMRVHATEGCNVVVLGPMLTPPDFAMQPWVRWEQAMLYKQYNDMIAGRWEPSARQFYTGNTSLARRHVIEAGGFDTRFRRAEDVELAYRLTRQGVRFVFNPKAIGYHYAERSFQSWMTTPYIYGQNDVIFTRDKGQDWLLPLVFSEFHTRNPLIQLLARLCVGRPRLAGPAIALLSTLAQLSGRLGWERLIQMAYSAIFNLRYYQGVADELGGRAKFGAALRCYPKSE